MENVEDILPLTPMQHAMLLHSLSRPEEDSLFNQFCYRLDGALHAEHFAAAWHALVQRHSAFRTAFVQSEKAGAMQIVHKTVELELQTDDWRRLAPDDRDQQFAAVKCEDRARGLDTKQAPLLRIRLVQVADESHWLVWSSHHLIVDRWCIDTIWAELASIYGTLLDGQSFTLAPAQPFSDYLRWLQKQSRDDADTYWQSALSDFLAPSLLTCRNEVATTTDDEVLIAPRVVEQLDVTARQCGVTRSVMLQMALSLAMYRCTSKQDIVFGVTVTGRPPDVAHVESIIGSFVCNVPVRARLDPAQQLGNFLKTMHAAQLERSAYEYLSPADIHSCSALQPSAPLFDTILVSLSGLTPQAPRDIAVTPMSGGLQTAVPLTIGIEESSGGLIFRTIHGAKSSPLDSAKPLLGFLSEYIAALSASAPDCRLDSLAGLQDLQPLPTTRQKHNQKLATSHRSAKPLASGGREANDAQMLRDLLRNEWQDVLAITDIAADDNFFSLGGDSLKAARLHSRIQDVARVTIPLLTLFQAVTLSGMAALLASKEWPGSAEFVLPAKAGDPDTPPLFLIASPEVNTVGYALLGRHLTDDRPAFVVQAPPVAAELIRVAPSAVPALAQEYLAEIRNIQPAGPYFLLGMCTGCQIAFEIAAELERAGEEVRHLGVINTWAHFTVGRLYHVHFYTERLKYYGRRLLEHIRLPPGRSIDSIRSILRNRFRQRAGSQPTKAGNTEAGRGAKADVVDEQHDPWIADFGWARLNPQAEKYPGTVTVYRIARQPYWRTGERDLGWGFHAQHTHVVELDGNSHHNVMREPRVGRLAEKVEQELARTRRCATCTTTGTLK